MFERVSKEKPKKSKIIKSVLDTPEKKERKKKKLCGFEKKDQKTKKDTTTPKCML